MTSTASHSTSEPRSFGEMLADLVPLAGFIAVAGPPPLMAAGALLLFGLMLVGPFAVIVTLFVAFALVVAALAAVAAALVAVVSSPYILARAVRGHEFHNPFLLVAHRARVASGGSR